MLSVICPIYNEEKYIAGCIESILRQDYPKDDLEVIFADGMSSDRTREIVTEYAAKYPFIKLIDNPQRIVPTGLNAAIAASKGDTVIRLDAHAEYPTNYFSELTRQLEELNADNVGGVCITVPVNDSAKAKAIAAVLGSRFGMGNSDFRVGASKVKQVDTVPFGCWPREIFNRLGMFDEELTRNQDDEFNGRITKSGGKIFLLPHVQIKYYARDKINKVGRMFFQYGLFKPLVNRKLGSPATLRQFVPPALVLWLFIGALISILWHSFVWVYLGITVLYLLLALFFSLKSNHSAKQILLQTTTYAVVHLSYGFGYIVGLYKLMTNKTFSAKINR